MGTLELLKTISLKHIDDRVNELKNQFIEMGQLKSEFDIEKFTIKKEGNFIAHNFHFLMRQYSLALFEARRMLIEKEELTRRLEETQESLKRNETKIIVWEGGGKKEKYVDLYAKELENRIDNLDVTMVNKFCMVEYFEKCRHRLIELNGGKAPDNRQYQREEPEYWKWFAEKKILQQVKQSQTGITESIWELIDHISEAPILNPNYHIEFEHPDLAKLEERLSLEKKKLLR